MIKQHKSALLQGKTATKCAYAPTSLLQGKNAITFAKAACTSHDSEKKGIAKLHAKMIP